MFQFKKYIKCEINKSNLNYNNNNNKKQLIGSELKLMS